jgi:hypothetical protein
MDDAAMGWRKLFGTRPGPPEEEAATAATVEDPETAAAYAALCRRRREEVVAVAERMLLTSGIAAASSGHRVVEELCSFIPAGYPSGPPRGEAVVVVCVDGVYLRLGSHWDSVLEHSHSPRFVHVDEHGEEMAGGSDHILTLSDLGRSIESSTASRTALGVRTNAEARAEELEAEHRRAQQVWDSGMPVRQIDRRARIDRARLAHETFLCRGCATHRVPTQDGRCQACGRQLL